MSDYNRYKDLLQQLKTPSGLLRRVKLKCIKYAERRAATAARSNLSEDTLVRWRELATRALVQLSIDLHGVRLDTGYCNDPTFAQLLEAYIAQLDFDIAHFWGFRVFKGEPKPDCKLLASSDIGVHTLPLGQIRIYFSVDPCNRLIVNFARVPS
jgi:hypothetical protein